MTALRSLTLACLISGLLLGSTAMGPAVAHHNELHHQASQNAKDDATFRNLASKFVGFTMISNTPPLPDARIINGDHQPVSLKDFKGKALLINF